MVNGLIRHAAKWTAPSPLWTADLPAGMSARNGSPWQPAILRFDNDLFMEEALALLAYHPEQLAERIARPETWTKPMKRPATISRAEAMEPISEFSKTIRRQADRNALPENALVKVSGTAVSVIAAAAADEIPFKLYQPAHQRFYLVAASLVCQQASMPDRRIDAGKREAVGFVLRRVSYSVSDEESKKAYDAADDDWSEYAYTATADGFAWKLIPSLERTQVQTGEERLPLFAMHFSERDGRRRRMLAGLIPVGRREAYLSAPAYEETDPADLNKKQEKAKDALQALFEAQVLAPWQALVEQAKAAHETLMSDLKPLGGSDREEKIIQARAIIKEAREKIQTGSWYVLLDFAGFLEQYVEQAWKKLTGVEPDRTLTPQEDALILQLKSTGISDKLKADLVKNMTIKPEIPAFADALVKIHKKEVADALENAAIPYDRRTAPVSPWPGFLFPLADPGVEVSESDIFVVSSNASFMGPLGISVAATGWDALADEIAKIDIIGELVKDAVSTAVDVPEIQSPQLPLNAGDGWFVIRCVYERPNCGPLNPAVLSAPTEKFLMAPFFDPDAPARPVRISLPMDISPAGLRKFKKNATLMMSDMLCGKVKRIRKLTFGDLVLSVLPWPFHQDLPDPGKTGPCTDKGVDAGMYCSLSIPIVTLAALILMIIIVSLFDMFFRWMPFLFTCFPIPGMKGKKA